MENNLVFTKPDDQKTLTSLVETLARLGDVPTLYVLIKVLGEPERIVNWRFVQSLEQFLSQAFSFGSPDSENLVATLREALESVAQEAALLGVLVKYRAEQVVNWQFIDVHTARSLALILATPQDAVC